MEIGGQIIGPDSADTLVQSHGPQRHGSRCVAEHFCYRANLLCRHTGNLCRFFRRVIFKKLAIGLEIHLFLVIGHEIDVFIIKTWIIKLFFNNDISHGIEDGQIGARFKRDMYIGNTGGVGPAGINDDYLDIGIGLFAGRYPLKKNRMAFGHIGADDEKTGGRIDILITADGFILAKGCIIAANGGSHAESGISLHIVAAQTGFPDLIG